ncbi:hypothetical protein M9Y10_044119 [Tritrichomonas musculus]|uniref:Hydrolase, TatD family protein n=1 Tax=Tritrichomonas musculus TaxID=1915356 RepID=A0ABR2K2M7_9EUKA
MLTDAHAHIADKEVINILKEYNIYTTACAMSPDECIFVESLSKQDPSRVIPTYGLHPWNSSSYTVDQMMPYLQKCIAIGEIGMDNVWCEVPLDIQRKVFIQQLDIAAQRGVPVILHTKGKEKEIAEIIENYKIPVLVHWYSCENYLDMYLNKGYYFSIGPDIHKEKAVQKVAATVPIDRILIETDGIEGIAWAIDKPATSKDIPSSLKTTLESVAKLRGIEPSALQTQVNENWQRLFKKID